MIGATQQTEMKIFHQKKVDGGSIFAARLFGFRFAGASHDKIWSTNNKQMMILVEE